MLSEEILVQAEKERLFLLSQRSQRDDVVLVEFVFGNKFVQFDISTMQSMYLTPEQLVADHFIPAMKAVGMPTSLIVEPSTPLVSSSSRIHEFPQGA